MNMSLILGCGAPGLVNGVPNALQLSLVVEGAMAQLNQQNCAAALSSLSPLYNSTYTNNAIRMATASAYACFAQLKVLSVALNLTQFQGSLGGAGLWTFLVQEFPSTASPDDRIPESAENGIDAVLAAVNPGAVIATSDWINKSTFNPGVLLSSERIDDANSYLTFLSMALIGSLLNRYGAPYPNYKRSVALPWTSASATKGDGCAMAAAMLNFFDGISFLSSTASGTTGAAFTSVGTLLTAGLGLACEAGCLACAAAGSSVSCTGCPLNLRDRSSCTGQNSDVNSCAAAGIASFINSSWSVGP